MKLIIVRGAPGTGKTTFVGKMFSGIFHIENDMFHMKDGKYMFDCRKQNDAIAWCLNACDAAMSCGMDVVVSNTFTKPGYIESYMRLAERYGAVVEVYRMHGDFKNVHSVPENVLKNMREHFKDWPGEKHVYPDGDNYMIESTERL